MGKKKSGGVNKSAMIRSYAEAHPDAKPKQIADALAAQGIEVSNVQVSTVLHNAKKAAGGSTTRATTSTPRPSASNPGTTTLDTALDLVRQAGGIDQARAALDLIARIKAQV